MLRFNRLSLLRFVTIIAFAILASKLWQLQIVEGDKYRSMENRNSVRMLTLKAPRGVVYDRNLSLLVGNKPSWVVLVTPADLPEDDEERVRVYELLEEIIGVEQVVAAVPADVPEEAVGRVVAELGGILNLDEADIRSSLEEDPESETPVLLKRGITPVEEDALQARRHLLPGLVVESELRLIVAQAEDAPFTPVVVKANLEREKALLIDVNHLKLPGVTLGREPVRQYADGSTFSHVIGFVGRISREEYEASKPPLGSQGMPTYDADDIVGKTGVEASFEEALRGRKGGETVLVNPSGRIIRVLSEIPAVPGNNVVLTIDADFQRAVTESLQRGLKRASEGLGLPVESGVAVAMDPRNGEIYAMVSLPTYDNNLFAEGISVEDFQKLQEDPNYPMVNKAISGLYPPGSTFKIFVAAAGLQEGVITPSTTYNCPGRIDVAHTWGEGTTPYYCWLRSGHGLMNVEQALAESCDVFFYNVAAPGGGGTEDDQLRYFEPGSREPHLFRGLGIERINDYMAKFGLSTKTGIDLPGELTGVIPGPEWKQENFPDDRWTLGDTLLTGIGQGYDLMTPLELLVATSAIANGGTVYRPQVAGQLLDSEGRVVKDFNPEPVAQIPVSAENLAIVRRGMEAAVSQTGTAYRIVYPDLSIAGKTGTAEYGPRDENGDRRSHAWFVAFAPADDPQIAVVVMLDGGGEGSTYAVPVAGEILREFFNLPPAE